MAANAWIQFNAALIREGHFKEDKFKKQGSSESSNTKETPTFGQWLHKEWHNVPEIPYPTSPKKTPN